MSTLSRQATALEICDIVYGNSNPDWEAIEHFYEASAGGSCLLSSRASTDQLLHQCE